MDLPVTPPVSPMLAKAAKSIPLGEFAYEPKWDGFRAIVFRDGDQVEIGSRNTKPMTRYFPELVEAVKGNLPERCVVDGEIVVAIGDRLEFEVLQQRIHPAASRIELLAEQTPASFVAFDLLALDQEDLTGQPFAVRRARLEQALGEASSPVHLTPLTTDPAEAADWFERFEGAGLDGIIGKPLDGPYLPGKRTMTKVKHQRTADCVVAGYRVHKSGPEAVGSLLLGLYNDDGDLASVGVIGSFTAARRKELFAQMQPLVTTFDDHPWAWANPQSGIRTPRSSEHSRWNSEKDLSFTPVRPELVVEVRYEHMQGTRFRHMAQFNRWRPDREPRSCTFDQLEEVVGYDLADIFN
ncbi:MAG: ATP-dependent DNA ligase [Beutenbergiaceae bacterium]